MITNLTEACDIVFLALMVWREARNQTYDARVQVAWTVKNRVQHKKWWGDSYTSVIFKRYQYSSMTDPKDNQLSIYPMDNDIRFVECLGIASDVVNESIKPTYASADSYYDNSIDRPYWATDKNFLGKIGAFSFHNVDEEID